MIISTLLSDLSAIAIAGSILGALARFARLPVIAGYVLAGYFIGPHAPYGFSIISDPARIQSFAEVGTILLLFGIGLEMGFRRLTQIGLAPLFVGLGEALGMWYLGTQAAEMLGYRHAVAQFLGAALAISSTTVILALLKEKSLATAKFAETLVGILLVEDLIAIVMLFYLPNLAQGGSTEGLISVAWQLVGNLFLWWLAGTIVVPRLVALLRRRGGDEILLLAALGLCFGLAELATSLNFSAALGAFVMGAILADSRESRRIESLVRPIRQMFGLLFFVSFGMLFSPDILIEKWETVLVLLGVLVAGKATLSFLFSLLAGKDVRDALRVAGSLGQIGEFSFVILQVGSSTGVIPDELFPILAAVSFATIFLTPLSLTFVVSKADAFSRLVPDLFTRWHQSYVRALNTASLGNLPVRQKGLGRLSGLIDGFVSVMRQNYRELTSGNTSSTLGRLAPWDEYLSEVLVGPGSSVEGRSLLELNLRTTYGVNVVGVARNLVTRIAPDPALRLLPGDELLIYGTEEAMARFARACEGAPLQASGMRLTDCDLAALRLDAAHAFAGRSIRELNLRESKSCIILALVRDDVRIKNPDADFRLAPGDEVYIVGPRASLATL